MSTVDIAERICEKWEGFAKLLPNGKVQAYWDAIGKRWTIGMGVTGPDVFEGVIWTPEQCRHRSLDILSNLIEHISRMVTRPIADYQMGALGSLAYNTGLDEKADGVVTAFGIDSSLLRDVNAGDDAAAGDAFLAWCHSGRDINGKPIFVQGLYNRRVYERGVYLGEITP